MRFGGLASCSRHFFAQYRILGFAAEHMGLGFRVYSFRVQGLGCRGLGFRV